MKERINKWLKDIKASNSDWCIVQVITHGSLKGNKPKLQLPRSSVFDKIKSDFGGGKANERLVTFCTAFCTAGSTVTSAFAIKGSVLPLNGLI